MLDTDVFSYLLKGKGDNAERYRKHVIGRTVAISFITIGEIYSGLIKQAHPRRDSRPSKRDSMLGL